VTRFLVPAGASVVVGLLLGAASIFGVTLMIQQDTKPPLSAGDPASSVLNRVEYGNRG
jgi:tetrahydrodipicolinate N-succinyltransferase